MADTTHILFLASSADILESINDDTISTSVSLVTCSATMKSLLNFHILSNQSENFLTSIPASFNNSRAITSHIVSSVQSFLNADTKKI
ncbi:MAG: hypothetical protein PF569_02100 [Candidatus Woesearchaeota archaeon]|nr:hypothetical protein [Candidatus Woesearchaeota archaeon]